MRKLSVLFSAVILFLFILCSCSSAEIKNISVDESELSLTVGDTYALSVEVNPEDAEIKKLTWLSSDKSIVTVNDGIVKAVSAGNAVVTVKTENNVKASCNISVADKEIESVTLSESSTSVKVGSKIQLTASVRPKDAPESVLEWSSEDTSIASVNNEGYVKGVKEGTTNIFCKSPNGKKAFCSVTVKAVTQKATAATDANAATSKAAEKEVNNYYIYNGKGNNGSSSSYGGVIFPDSSVRKLSESEVRVLSSNQAQDAINEIYARNGYIFKTKSIQQYYEAQSWYYPNANFSTNDVNSIESYNINLLSKYR